MSATSPKFSRRQIISSRRQIISLGIVVCASIVPLSFFKEGELFFPPLPIKDNIDVVSIFTGILIIVALIERTIELFIPLLANDPKKAKDDEERARYTKERINTSLISGLVAGFIASIVGIRILSPLVDIDSVNSPQKEIFTLVDIVFSGIGISLGSQLFHIFPSLTSSVLEAVKEQSDANAESSKLRKKEAEKEIISIEEEMREIRLEKLKSESESLNIEQEMRSENSTIVEFSEEPIETEESQ